MASFLKRNNASEIMDDLEFSDDVIYQTLRELDFINKWLGGNEVTLNALASVLKKNNEEGVIFIADLGCGSGEMLRLISKLAEKKKQKVQLLGIDANPNVVDYAEKKSVGFENLIFHSMNIFSGEFQQKSFDIILATLLLHHLTDEELISLLASMKKQAKTIIVNDIHRHPLAYYSITWLTKFFSKSSMVKFDAPLSVLRAFKQSELKSILEKAGIENYKLKWKWAFRWQLIIHC